MKSIHVAAGIIIRTDDICRVLAAQRGYGELQGLWELPGGKLEPSETPQQALHRELNEELGITVSIQKHYASISYDYPDVHLEMDCYLCQLDPKDQIPLPQDKQQNIQWLAADELSELSWMPADIELVARIVSDLSGNTNLCE